MRLYDVLIASAQTFPEKTAVRFFERQLSYRTLYGNACRIANALRLAGVKTGDTVCIISKNSIAYIETIFAISLAGAVPALVNWRVSPSAIHDMVLQTGAKLAFVSNTERAAIEYIREREGDSVRLVQVQHDPAYESDYEAFSAGMSDHFSPAKVPEESPGMIMFTSGTSGQAKGVVLSHQALTTQIQKCAKVGNWSRDDIFMVLSPLFHSISLSVMAVLYAGGELLLCSADMTKYYDRVYEFIQREGVTRTAMVPTVINRLVTYMEQNGLHNDSLRYIHYGGAPMSEELLHRCRNVFSCRFHQGYGMTETYGTVTALLPEDHLNCRHLSSVGRPMTGNEIRIVNENGQELPPLTAGEILVRTDTVMTCYLGMPEKTAEVLKNGWYDTGDIGYLDETGYLYLMSRKNDMIITGGENVFPQEVESCILSMKDDVDAVCVTGIKDDIWGEIIVAAVVKKPDSTVDEEAIMNYCAEHLGRYKRPKRVLLLNAIPTTEMGKISRKKIRDLFTRQDNS